MKSICSIFRCSDGQANSLICDIDFESQRFHYDAQEYLFGTFKAEFGEPNPIEAVYWFHLTRTWEGNQFEEGILPLGNSLEIIWDKIIHLSREKDYYQNLIELRSTGVRDSNYSLKTLNPIHWGPHAMLIRESAFKSTEIGNYNYLELPEIIDDICKEYADKYGERIRDDMINILHPCIVKFQSTLKTDDKVIRAALFYLYSSMKGINMNFSCNTCFDGNNVAIPKKDIVKIEYVPT